jgi:hypothetical protein
MDTSATDNRSGPLSGSVEELCYHDQRVVVGNEGGSRTVASYEAEINCDSIIMRLNYYNFGSLT